MIRLNGKELAGCLLFLIVFYCKDLFQFILKKKELHCLLQCLTLSEQVKNRGVIH